MAGKLYEAPIGNKALDLLALRLTMRHIAATLSVIALLFSAGATLADDTDEANKLYIEAAKLIKLAENIEGFGEKAEVLEEALSLLNKIVDDHPSTNLAVKLLNGQDTEGISLEVLSMAAERALILHFEGGGTPENYVEQLMRIFEVLGVPINRRN